MEHVSWGYCHSLGTKNTRKIDKIYKDFELFQVFIYKFSSKVSQNCHFTYYLHTTQTTYYLSNLILYHYLIPTYLLLA